MEIFNFEQRSEEWYRVKLGVLSASEAATIAANGKGLETLCLTKAVELATGKMSDSYTNADIERGIELENTARSLYEITTGRTVEQVGFIKIAPHIGCSPDGLVGLEGLTEYKCKNDTNHFKRILGYPIEKEYDMQMQMQMFITDRGWCDYVCYNKHYPIKSQLIITRVYRDEEKIKLIQKGLDRGVELIESYLTKFKEKTK